MKIPSIKANNSHSESTGRPKSEGPELHVVLLLAGARLFFLVVGLVFLLGEALDVLVSGDPLSTGVIVRVAVLSIFAPVVVWISTRWAEKVFRQAFENQRRLIETSINRAAQDIQATSAAVSGSNQTEPLHRNEHAVLAQLGKIATSSLDIEDIYEQFTQEARNVLGFDLLVICAVDDSNSCLSREFTSLKSADSMVPKGQVLPLDGTMAAEAIKRRSTLITQGMGEDDLAQRYPGMVTLIRGGMRSFITSPMYSKNKITGILGIASKSSMKYSERDREFLESATLQIGGALANSQLHAILQRESHDRELLAEIGRVVSSSPHLDDVFERVGNIIMELIPAHRVSVALTSSDKKQIRLAFVSGYPISERNVGQLIPLIGTLTESVTLLRHGKIVQSVTEDEISTKYPGMLTSFRQGMISVMGVPLFSNDAVIGCLQLRSSDENAFDPEHLALAERIAEQIAGAMANSELNRTLEQEIAEKSALAEIGKTMGMSLDMEEVYERFGEIVSAVAPSDRFAVNLLSADGESLEIAYYHGEFVEDREIGTKIPFVGSIGGEVARTKSTIVLTSDSLSTQSERFWHSTQAVKAGFQSILATPLINDNELLGVMQFRSRAPNAYGESVVRVIENVASHVAGFLANANLNRELQSESKEKATLAEIGRLVSSSPDIHNIYERLSEQVKDIIPNDQISIGFLESETGSAKLAYVTGVAIPSVAENSIIKLDGSLNGKVISGRRGMIVQGKTFEELTEEFPSMTPGYRAGLRSAIGVPLVANDRVIGCLQFRSLSESAYTTKHLELAERVSDQISGALANSELRAVLEHEITERAALAEIVTTITMSLKLEDVYDRFAALVKPLTSADRITISLLTDDEEAVHIAYTSGGSIPGRNLGDRIPIDGTIAERAFKSRETVLLHCEDASELEGHLDRLIPSIHAGFKSFMAVPLMVQGKVIGVLQIRSRAMNAYTESKARLAESISSQVASAIANAQLHSTMEKESERRAALAEIGRIISSTLDLKTVYDAFADVVTRLIPFDRISINSGDPANGLLYNAFVRGHDVPSRRPGDTINWEDSVTKEVMTSGKTLLLQPIADEINDTKLRHPGIAASADTGVRSFLLVPLISQDIAVGALQFSSLTESAFDPEHVALAEDVAAQIAGAISSAQLHSQVTASQQALSQSEWRYRHMVESASDIVCTLDDQGYFTYVNQPITKVTEFTEDDLMGRHFTEIVAEDWKNRVLKTCIVDPREFGEECVMEFPIETKSGRTCWLEQTIAPMFDDGKIIGFQGIARDISARKEIESERESLIEELQEAVDKIQTLSGLLPICSSCKKVRDDNGYWNAIETFISAHSDADFSHSICPPCVKKLYPQLNAATTGDA